MAISSEFRELHLAFILIAVIIGFEIALYFLYQYYKRKGENLELNKILIAFSLLYAFGLTGIFIRTINSFYVKDPSLNALFFNLAHISISFATISFLFIISAKPFQEILNTKVTRAIAIFAFTICFVILIIQIELLNLILRLLGVSIGSIYMAIFFLKLIKLATGNIKKRLIIITVGGVLVIGAILIGAEETSLLFTQEQQEILIIISGPVLIIGLMIIFLGMLKFPAFLEFGWRKNLLKLYIIDPQGLQGLYTFDFTNISANKDDNEIEVKSDQDREELFPKFILGVNDIINACIQTENKRTEKIKQGDLFILLAYSEPPISAITYALLVSKEMNSYNYFLKTIKNQFQGFYKEILLDLATLKGIKESLFSSFDIIIRNIIK